MAFISIIYNEPDHNTYDGVALSYGHPEQTKVFFSGDFVKDWYNCMKFIICKEINEPISNSSSLDHFIMDGAPFDSAYLVGHDDEWELYVIDRKDPDWFVKIPKGIEFFIKDGTAPTWAELKQYCNENRKDG